MELMDLTLSSEIVNNGYNYLSITKFSNSNLERINSFANYFYIDFHPDVLTIYFELFKNYRLIFKYTYQTKDCDYEIISNSNNEVLLKTDDVKLSIDKIEEIYIETLQK